MMRSLLSVLAVTTLVVGSGCRAELPQSVKGASRNLTFKEIPKGLCILSVSMDGGKEAYTIRYLVANLGKEPLLHLQYPTYTEGVYRGSKGDLPSWTTMADLRGPQAIDVVEVAPGEVKQISLGVPMYGEERYGPAQAVRLAIRPWSLDRLTGGFPKRHWTKSMTWPKQKLVSQELDLKTDRIVQPAEAR